MLEEPSPREILANAVKAAGRTNVVLCRCDNADAINYGREIGVCLFQGRHVDKLLREFTDQQGAHMTIRQARSMGARKRPR